MFLHQWYSIIIFFKYRIEFQFLVFHLALKYNLLCLHFFILICNYICLSFFHFDVWFYFSLFFILYDYALCMVSIIILFVTNSFESMRRTRLVSSSNLYTTSIRSFTRSPDFFGSRPQTNVYFRNDLLSRQLFFDETAASFLSEIRNLFAEYLKKKFSFQRNTWLEMNDVVYCGYTSDSRFHWSHRCIRLYACSVRSASLTFNIVQLFDPRFFSTTPESLYRYFHVSKNIELTE